VLAVVGAVSALSTAAFGQTLSHSSAVRPVGKNTQPTISAQAPGLTPLPAKQSPPAAYRATDDGGVAAWKAAHAGPVQPQPSPRGAPPNDNCANATVVTAGRTPYDAIGATTDGTMTCGFNVGNDVWFRFTATENGPVSVTTCDDSRSYDTVMSVYDGGCGSPAIGCDDDGGACTNPPGGGGFSGSLVTFNGVAGSTYTIQVGCYNSGPAGVSALTVTAGACELMPPGPGTPENEPCGTDTNGGCNSTPPIFNTISCGEVVDGNAWASAGTRDTDWYRLELDGPTQVTVNGQAQFPLQLFIISDACPASIIAAGSAPTCGTASVTATVGGSCLIFAGNTGFDGNPCGGSNDYWIQVATCTPVKGPDNDQCADATEVGEGTFDYDLAASTNDWPGSCGATGAAPDVWFRYTASFTGTAVVSTCGLTTGDSTITVLEECGGPEILCLDDFCGLQTEVTFGVTTGEDYLIRLAGFAGNIHAGQFSIAMLAPCVLAPPDKGTPENEPCGTDTNGGCNSIPPIFGTISCGEVVSGTAWASAGTRDTDWYELTLDGPHSVTISGQAQFPLQLFIIDNNCPPTILGAASAARCDVATLTVLVGGTCRIFAGNTGFDGNACGNDNDYWVSVDDCTPVEGPSNDACADAIDITGNGPHSFDNTLATTDGAGDPLCLAFGTDQINNDLWYHWTSTCSDGQEVSVTTCGLTGVDTRIAVYQGTDCVGPIVACNDDDPSGACGLQTTATWIAGPPGTVYTIRVGNFPGAAGGAGAFMFDCNKPCMGVSPDPNGISENEDCGADTNGGCNAAPFSFFDVSCNATVNGTSWAAGGTRDTDWYRVTVPDSGTVSVTVTSSIPEAVFILNISGGANPDCITIGFDAIGGTNDCGETATISASGLPAGDSRYIFIGPGNSLGGGIFDGFPCGSLPDNNYTASFDIGVPCGNACPCNFNHDAFLNSQDFFDFLTCFFGGGCPAGEDADYNNDNFVNSQDFFDFLTCFFAPPKGCN
jgi:hypothetical protein